MSGEVEVAYSAGRRKGTSAPYQRATSAISSESVDTTTRSKDVALQRGLDRVREERVAGERADVLVRHALRSRAGGNERDRARRAHFSPAAPASSVSAGQGTPSRSAARSTTPTIASSSERRPAATSRAADGFVSAAISSMIVHCVDARSPTPSAPATSHVSATAASRRGRQSGSLRSSPTVLPEAAHAAASGAIRRELVPEDALLALPDPDVEPRLAQNVRSRLDLGTRETLGRDGDDGRSRRLDDLHAPGPVGLEVRDASRRDPVAEALAQQLHVLEAVQERDDDTVGDGVRIDALDGVLERGCLDRDEEKADGLRELLDDLHARRQRSLGRLDDESGERDEAGRLGMRDADHGHAGVREAHGERAADGARAENCRSRVHVFAGSTTRLTTF